MHRTTISLSDDIARLVQQEAVRRGTSVSEVIRSSVLHTLVGSGKRDLPFASICEDPALPAASDLETTLEETWQDDLDRSNR